MRFSMLLVLISLFLMTGCGSANTVIIIGSIDGPDHIAEYDIVEFTINPSEGSGLKFLWSVVPPNAGAIVDNTLQTIKFQADKQSANLAAEIRVEVTSGGDDVEISTHEILIENRDGSWARTIGGIENDRATGVTADSAENIYMTGYFMDTVDFDPGPAEDIHTSAGKEDCFLAKFSPGGDLIWARTWGGPGIESGNVVDVDFEGNVVVAGWSMNDCDFDPGPGFLTFPWYGENDLFVSKFTPGGDLIWAKAWGGAGWDIIHGMSTSSDGSIYLGIEFFGIIDLDPGPGVANFEAVAFADIALCKLDKAGNYQWAHAWGSEAGDGSDGIVFDHDGNLFVTGDYSFTIDFDPGPGEDILTSNGERDVFLMKWNANDEYQWTKSWGASGPTVESWDKGNGIDVDENNNVVVAGMFTKTVDFDPGLGEFILESAGMADIFTCKFDQDGNFLWANSMGGSEYDIGIEVQFDIYGNVYTVGAFKAAADFDSRSYVDNHDSAGNHDSFLTRVWSDGHYDWTLTWGDWKSDYAHDIYCGNYGLTVIVVGSLQVANEFGYHNYSDIHESNGRADIFIRKVNPLRLEKLE